MESKSDLLAAPFPKSEPPSLVPPKSDPVVVVEFPKREPCFGGLEELPKREPVAVPPKRLPDLGAENGLAVPPNKLFGFSSPYLPPESGATNLNAPSFFSTGFSSATTFLLILTIFL